MRTVTFSNQKIQDALNDNFVNTFINTTGDPTAGMSIDHSPSDRAGNCVRGNGKQNVQTLFLTPEGEIFHAATGFLSSEDLLTEVSFATDLFEQVEQSEDVARTVAGEHRRRLVEAGFSEDEMNDRSPMAAMRMMASQMNQSQDRRSDPFAAFSKRQFLTDNKFSMKHPMMNIEEFQSDPTSLVGNGKSFFSSSSSSSNQ